MLRATVTKMLLLASMITVYNVLQQFSHTLSLKAVCYVQANFDRFCG